MRREIYGSSGPSRPLPRLTTSISFRAFANILCCCCDWRDSSRGNSNRSFGQDEDFPSHKQSKVNRGTNNVVYNNGGEGKLKKKRQIVSSNGVRLKDISAKKVKYSSYVLLQRPHSHFRHVPVLRLLEKVPLDDDGDDGSPGDQRLAAAPAANDGAGST